ncbi:MAG: PucR family transcriptional regulator [Thermus sp.]|nr:PucR family transcriptional regulator [Thermus sp.]
MPGLPIGELLGLPTLSRARVLGGDLAKEVSWVHVVDLPDPAPWVGRGHLVLSTGYAWPREERQLRVFAEALAEREPAGVVLAVPQFFEHFPERILEVLGRRGVVILELPWEVPFAQVTEEVLRKLLARQLEVQERVQALHRALMQAVLEREDLETLLARLSQLLGRTVRVVSYPEGFAVPIPLGREQGGFLALEGGVEELERQVVENAALVAGLILAHQRALAEREARLGYAFLDALLEGRREALSWERARAFNLDLAERYRLGVLVLPLALPLSERDFHARDRIAQEVRDLLKRQGASVLLSLSLNQVRFLLPERLDPYGFYSKLPSHWPLYLSRPRRAGELEGALEEVERLFAFSDPGLYLYESQMVPRFLLGDDEARKELKAWLSVLHPRELEALLAWTRLGFSQKRATKALGIHLNTLRYRLRRIEEKLGLSLQDPEDRFRLELAARILSLGNKNT